MNIFGNLLYNLTPSIIIVIKFIAFTAFLIGVLECFAGYKIYKIMIVVWGFVFGFLAGIVFCTAGGIIESSVGAAIAIGIILGAAMSVLAYKFYLTGIFILVGMLTFFAFYFITSSVMISIALALVVGISANFFVKPVIMISTAFSGASIMLLALCLLLDASDSREFIYYILWIIISVDGIVVQLKINSYENSEIKKKKKIKKNLGERVYRNVLTPSERKYPGMQKAYRNFCIECGCRLSKNNSKCPYCGLEIKD